MNPLPSIPVLLEAGIIDLRAPQIAFVGSDNDRDLGVGATGIQSMIGPYMVDRFELALSCLVVSEDTVFEEQAIDVRYVLAQPWRLNRLENCCALRADGAAPRIDVNRISFPGLPDFFQIVNGCHRAFAARRNGDLVIDALIHTHRHCDPSAFFISGQSLLRGSGSVGEPVAPGDSTGPTVPIEQSTLALDTIAILNVLGCRAASAPTMAWSRGS